MKVIFEVIQKYGQKGYFLNAEALKHPMVEKMKEFIAGEHFQNLINPEKRLPIYFFSNNATLNR
mgnify:CR=1 FL=1